MQYFSVSPIRLFPSPPLSVWNRFPVCGEFAPLLALLCRHMLRFTMPLDARSASSPSLTYWTNLHPMFFCFSLFVCSKTLISHIQFRDGFVASTMKCPEKFLHAFGELLIYYWPLSDKSVQLQSNKSFLQSPSFVVVQFCVVYATQNVNSYMRRLCVGCFLSCLRCTRRSYSFYQLLLHYRGILLRRKIALWQQWAH